MEGCPAAYRSKNLEVCQLSSAGVWQLQGPIHHPALSHATTFHKEPVMHKPYRFLNTGIQAAALNMAIDESVLMHHLSGQVPPTLRVFSWSQPAISLGRFQSIEREILSDVCQQRGVALVRRPTGGRAVYHLDEVTYSLVIGKHYGVPTGIVAAYAYLASGLQAALATLGVHAQLSEEHVNK